MMHGSIAHAVQSISHDELVKREKHWRFFRIVFVLTYTGMVMDVATTALGFRKGGDSYEQNPLGGFLINNLGWFGLLALLTAISFVCYVSCRTVLWQKSMRWGTFLNSVFVVLSLLRWVAVVTAVLYLVEP
jgi:hypothetical protein